MMNGPDQSWSWVVAVAACSLNFVVAGIVRASGILFIAFIEIFGVDRKTASKPFMIRTSIRNLFAPIVGILVQKYGARRIMIIGSVVGTFTTTTIFFAPDMAWITGIWGFSGIGAGLVSVPPQSVIMQYFDKHRSTASGIYFSGACIGAFILPALVEWLIYKYGVGGTFLILGAITLHCLPAALILRKPSWLKNPRAHNSCVASNLRHLSKHILKDGNYQITAIAKSLSSTENQCESITIQTDVSKTHKQEDCVVINNAYINERKSTHNTLNIDTLENEMYPDFTVLKDNCELVAKILNYKNQISTAQQYEDAANREINVINIVNRIESLFQQHRMTLQLRNSSINVKNNMKNTGFPGVKQFKIFNSRNCKSDAKLISICAISDSRLSVCYDSEINFVQKLLELQQLDPNIVTSIFKNPKADSVLKELDKLRQLLICCPQIENKCHNHSQSPDCMLSGKASTTVRSGDSKSFLELFKTALRLYSNALFLLVCLGRSVHIISFMPTATVIVDFCMDKGLLEEDGKFAIGAFSIGDLMGRLCLGWITDKGFMTLPKYMLTMMILEGVCAASLPVMQTKWALYINLALFGMLEGSIFVRGPVILSKYVKTEEHSIAVGCYNLIPGLLGFLVPLYIGHFRDVIGTYDYFFYINGFLSVMVGLLWTMEPIFVRYLYSKQRL